MDSCGEWGTGETLHKIMMNQILKKIINKRGEKHC